MSMAAGWACPAGVVRRHGDEPAAIPRQLVVQLSSELEPSLIEDRLVQTGLGPNLLTRLFGAACRRFGHVAYLQILDTHHRVVLADRGRGFVQVVAAAVADAGVDTLDAGFRLLPVVAEPGLAAHGLLRFAQGRFMPLEAVERRVERAVRECGEADHAHVDTHCCGGLRHGLLNFALGLDAYEPLAARLAHGDISDCAQHLATIAVAQPSQLGQEDTTVALIELDLLRVGVAEAVALAFLLETWKVGPLGEEVAVGPLQILERLLQGMDRRIGQPSRFRAVAPLGEHLAQPGVAQLLLSALVALFLQRQPLVVDEPARAGEAAHLPLLLAVWP